MGRYRRDEQLSFRIGRRLAKIRQIKRLSKVEAAKRVGRTHTFIRQIEAGERTPSIEALVKLADIYNVSLDFLFGRTPVAGVNNSPGGEKMKIGDVIEIIGTDVEPAVRAANAELMTAKAAFAEASSLLESAQHKLWGLIREKYPELKSFEFIFRHDTLQIIIVDKRKYRWGEEDTGENQEGGQRR